MLFTSLFTLTFGILAQAQMGPELGFCYVGTRCNCDKTEKQITLEACEDLLTKAGFFGVGSWKGKDSKACITLPSKDHDKDDSCRPT